VTVGFGDFQRGNGIANWQQCPKGGKINILNFKKSYFLPSTNLNYRDKRKFH